jgi:hypothetical protein
MNSQPRAGRRVRKAVSNIKHIAHQLLGPQIIGAVRHRAVRAISGGMASPPAYKKGGKVHKTGMAKVHKGEVVLTAKKVKSLKKLIGAK